MCIESHTRGGGMRGREGRRGKGGSERSVVCRFIILSACAMIVTMARDMDRPPVFPPQAHKYWNFSCNKGSSERMRGSVKVLP